MSTPIRQFFKEHGISEVEAVLPDMAGIARGKVMPAVKFAEEEGMRMPESIFLQTVTGDYPEDDRAISPSEIDIVLRADPATTRVVPWAAEPTAQVIHDSFYADGRPVTMAPRYVLRRILELYAAQGWRPIVAPELEFYLVEPNIDADYPLKPPIGRSGRPEVGRQSYSIAAVNEFDPLFDDIYAFCEAQEIEIDTLIHEDGAVVDTKTGSNVFSDQDGNPSPLFFSHIAGLQKYLPAAMSLFAPNVNSFRRIILRHLAPINTQWGYDNRTAGLRVPLSNPENRRVENRLGGADANPYLAIAASLVCGYLGMREGLKPSEPVSGSAYDMPFGLPRNLEEAVRLLRDCRPLVEILGERFVLAYTAVKESEYDTFLQVISSWEREHLLLNV